MSSHNGDHTRRSRPNSRNAQSTNISSSSVQDRTTESMRHDVLHAHDDPQSSNTSRPGRSPPATTHLLRVPSPSALAASASTPTPVPVGSSSFAAGGDYIAFEDSGDEEQEDDKSASHSPENFKGKERAYVNGRDRSNGLKRAAGEMETEADRNQRMDTASRLTPWVEDVDWEGCRNLAEMMHKEVKSFVNYISPRPEEHEVRSMVVATITRAIRKSWPDAQVIPFGSFETKLYLPLGDIDLVIQSRTMENNEKRRILYNIAHVLRKANITDNVTVIAKAKVPIVKFVTRLGRFSVDISLNQGNGVVAGRVINRFLQELPALRSLVMVIKLFLSQRSMNEVYTGGLGSYAIVCMAVSFLQMHPKIRSGEIDPSENLGVLVMEFFELYGHCYNYDNTGISIRDGGTYFNKSDRGWTDHRQTSLLSIEDPNDISNDISKNSYNITRVRKTLAGAHEILTTTALMRARVLVSKAQGRYTRLRPHDGRHEYEDPSILGSVLGVTQETVNHRRMVRQLYEQSTLQYLLGLAPYRRNFVATDRESVVSRSRNVYSISSSAKAVESAWGEAEMDFSDSDKEVMVRDYASPDAEEESRYSKRYSRKRRKLDTDGKHSNNMNVQDTIFVSESEEEGGRDPSRINVGASSRNTEELMASNDWDVRNETRRAYWASKGMSGGGLEDSD